jgi:hypothetical protein
VQRSRGSRLLPTTAGLLGACDDNWLLPPCLLSGVGFKQKGVMFMDVLIDYKYTVEDIFQF